MNSSSSILVVLLVLSCFSSPSVTSRPVFQSKVDSKTISLICSETNDPKLCLQVLNPKVASMVEDLPGLCQLSIDKTRANATATRKFVKKLIRDAKKNSSTGPDVKGYLTLCYQLYDSVINTIDDECAGSFKAGDFALLKTDAVSLIDDIKSCEDDGKGPTPIPKTLYERNAVVKDLASIIAAISDRINHGKD